jgi:hypothetical protein
MFSADIDDAGNMMLSADQSSVEWTRWIRVFRGSNLIRASNSEILCTYQEINRSGNNMTSLISRDHLDEIESREIVKHQIFLQTGGVSVEHLQASQLEVSHGSGSLLTLSSHEQNVATQG